jgi:putative copper resistance protein D
MYSWFVVSMWLHLLAAIVWIGGLAFISMVLVPTLRAPGLRPHAVVLLRTAGKKFQRVAYASVVTLVVTGMLNLYFKAGGSTAAVTALLPTPYGRLLIAKVLLVIAIVALSLYHDFAVGPAAARAMEADPAGAAALSLRKRASWLGRVNILLSLVVMTLALLLVRGIPV